MTGNAIIKDLLKKYDLMLPILASEQRRIYGSKRKTLSFILGRGSRNRAFVSAAVRFYYMLNGIGLRINLASAGRVAVFATFLTLLLFAGGSALLVQNYIYRDGSIARRGETIAVITAAEEIRITRSGMEAVQVKPPFTLKQGDEIITGNRPALFQLDNGSVVKVNRESTVFVTSLGADNRFDLKRGGMLSRVNHGTERGVYRVDTAESSAEVAGTEFGVLYINGKTTVFVKTGIVKVRHKPTGAEYTVNEGESSDVDGGKKLRQLNESEVRAMKGLSLLEFTGSNDSISSESLEAAGKQLGESEGEEKKAGMSLDDIKLKYGRVDEVLLYNGRIIRGAIISRGAVYRVQTVNGMVNVPVVQVKGSKIIE